MSDTKRAGSSIAAKRGRGRPRAYDPETALDRAGDTFWRNGFDGTSLDDLAAATGMNRPSLYAAFGDKHALYLQTLQRYRAKSQEIGRHIVEDDPPLRVFLERLYASSLDIYYSGEETARGCYSIGTAATQAVTDPKVRDYLMQSILGMDDFFAQRVALAAERGEIPGRDVTALAQQITSVVHTVAIRSRAGAKRAQLEALIEKQIAAICDGLT